MRKAQITIFMIVGVMLAIAILISVGMINFERERQSDREILDILRGSESPSLKTYVEACIKIVSMEDIIEIGKRGGSLGVQNNYFYINKSYNIICEQAGYIGCLNNMMTLNRVESELQNNIAQNLSRCIDLDIFREHGYNVTDGFMDVKVTLGIENVNVRVNYPISVRKEDEIETVSKFSEEIDYPIGKAVLIANEIVNSEIQEGTFYQDRYMMEWLEEHYSKLEIIKRKPYPYILYSLFLDGYEFDFAIQGEDTVSQLGVSPAYEYHNELGCCHVTIDAEEYCFVNSEIDACTQNSGIYYDKPCECELDTPGEEIYIGALCDGGPCQDCTNTWNPNTLDYTGPTRQHGESWCIYDSITNRGMDYVGSRHYRHVCIDGKEYSEECRDYREELCTEYSDFNGLGHAVCRLNRWFDCTNCDTQECCEDDRYRDCFWEGENFPEMVKKCHPLVSPGFRFWEGNGIEVCSEGYAEKEFNVNSNTAQWLNENAKLCTRLGDCGNYRNILDKKSDSGFYELDLRLDPEDNFMYNQMGLNNNYRKLEKVYDIDYSQTATKIFSKPIEMIPRIFSSLSKNIRNIYAIEPTDLLNPFNQQSNIKIYDMAVCGLYSAPDGNSECDLCDIDPFKPCSEYRCMSLGLNCLYDSVDNNCFPGTTDSSPPTITVETPGPYSLMPNTLTVHSTEFEGYTFVPNIKPYDLLRFNLKTNEPTQCKFDFMPRIIDDIPQGYMPDVWFGDMRFSEVHNITMRIPPHVSIPEKLLDIFDLENAQDLYNWFEFPDQAFNDFRSKYGSELDLYRARTGRNIESEIGIYVQKINLLRGLFDGVITFATDLINVILEQFDNNGYYLFVKCIDKSGNTNEDELFIQINIADDDNDPPIILSTVPDNDTKVFDEIIPIKLFVNEPSDCVYSTEDLDYYAMENEMNCVQSSFDLSPEEHGSYECLTTVNLTESDIYYFRCRDRPAIIQDYTINFFKSGIFDVYGGISDFYYSLTEPNRISVSNSVLTDSNIKFIVNQTFLDLDVYFDDKKDCRITSDNTKWFDELTAPEEKFDKCVESNDIGKGVYSCSKRVNIYEGDSIEQDQLVENYSMIFHFASSNHLDDESLRENIIFDGNNIDILRREAIEGNGTDVFINNTFININLHLFGRPICKWSTIPLLFDSMPNDFTYVDDGLNRDMETQLRVQEDNYQIYIACSNQFDLTTGNNSVFYIKCQDQNVTHISERLISQESYMLDLFEAERLNYDVEPNGIVENNLINLSIHLNNRIDKDSIFCGYNTVENSGYLPMNKLDNVTFIKNIDLDYGETTFFFLCIDRFDNSIKKNVTLINE